MGIIKEFQEFAVKGNVLDMAVGIIIGGAFGTIVKSLVDDVIMPPIGLLLGGVDFSDLFISLKGGAYASLAAAKEAGLKVFRTWGFNDKNVTYVPGGLPQYGGEGAGDTEVVFVGYGVVAPEYHWDDFKGVDVRGKTVVMLVGDPPVPDPRDTTRLDPGTFRGAAMTYYGRWTYKFEEAARRGAVGVGVLAVWAGIRCVLSLGGVVPRGHGADGRWVQGPIRCRAPAPPRAPTCRAGFRN